MISEPQQEQAALYALGLLDADEAEAFEREVDATPELRAFVRELRDTVSSLAWLDGDGSAGPAPALKTRVMQNLAATLPEKRRETETTVVRYHFAWLPWAAAALLLGCSAWLGTRLIQQRRDFAAHLADARKATPVDPLTRVSFCELEPTPELTNQPRAAVLWDESRRRGILRVNKLPLPAPGKDYELWTVEAGRKDAVSAGLVKVDAEGRATVPFEPGTTDHNPVVALAISLEKAGGSPTNQGPILLLGKL